VLQLCGALDHGRPVVDLQTRRALFGADVAAAWLKERLTPSRIVGL
jgi:hypothetical protein